MARRGAVMGISVGRPSSPRRWFICLFTGIVLVAAVPGCSPFPVREGKRKPESGPTWSLRSCDEVPSYRTTSSMDTLQDSSLLQALERSLNWYQRTSSREPYPMGPVSHRDARLSLRVLRHGMQRMNSPDSFTQFLRRNFNCYRPRHEGTEKVRFTGYFSPVYEARRRPTDRCDYPLYRKPPDLSVDPSTGEVLGEPILWGWLGYRPYPGRGELETGRRLQGLELVYLCSRLDQYFAHIQGAAKLRFRDGSTMLVRYAASNGRRYVSVGQELKQRENPPMKLTLQGIRSYFRRHPDQLDTYLRMNPRFIFFESSPGNRWPSGSIGVKLTPFRSLATSSQLFPPAAAVFVHTRVAGPNGEFVPFSRIMFNQDTGGAFQSTDRADIYFGAGPDAGRRAGRQSSMGTMKFLFIKPARRRDWEARLGLDWPVESEGRVRKADPYHGIRGGISRLFPSR